MLESEIIGVVMRLENTLDFGKASPLEPAAANDPRMAAGFYFWED